MNDIKTYYLPIDTKNIAKLFSLGCICPSKYFDQWNNDLQSVYGNSILLCGEKYTDRTSCCLEIVFTNEEDVTQISNDFYTFSMPLPISRVKKVFFQNTEKSSTTIYDIEKGDAFIPQKLIEVDNSSKVISTAQLHSVPKETSNNKEWSNQIDLFEKIIGGFALMRLGRDADKNYSTNYFKTLSKINQHVRNELSLSNLGFDKYLSSFIDNTHKSKIYNTVDYEIVSKLSIEENVKLERKVGNIIIDNITNDKVYVAAILASYGNDKGKRKSIDKFIADLVTGKFKKEFIEELCLVFGINQGYDAFRNNYEFNGKLFNVKYKLDSRIDYYIIESVYQYVFNKRISENKFKYLDSWCPKYSNNDVNKKKYITYRILDKDIIFKKKAIIGSQDYIYELLQRLPEDSVYYELINIFSDWFPPFLKTDKDSAKDYFKKTLSSTIHNIVKETVGRVKEDIYTEDHDNERILHEKINYLSGQIEEISNEKRELSNKNKKLLDQSNGRICNNENDDSNNIDIQSSVPTVKHESYNKQPGIKDESNDRQTLEQKYKSKKDSELKTMLKEYDIQFDNNKGYLIKLLLDAKMSKSN